MLSIPKKTNSLPIVVKSTYDGSLFYSDPNDKKLGNSQDSEIRRLEPVHSSFLPEAQSKKVTFEVNKLLIPSRYAIKYCSITSTLTLEDNSLNLNNIKSKEEEKLDLYTEYLKTSYGNRARHLRHANPLYTFAIYALIGPLEIFDERYDCDGKSTQLSFFVRTHNAILMPIFPGITAYDFCEKIRNDDSFSLYQFFSLTQTIVSAFVTMAKNGSRHGDVNPGNILIDQKNNDVYSIHILDTEHSCFIGETLGTTTGEYFYWSHDRTYQPEDHSVLEREYHDIYGLLKIFVSLLQYTSTLKNSITRCVILNLKKRMTECPEEIDTFDNLMTLLLMYRILSSTTLSVTPQQLEYVLIHYTLHKQLMDFFQNGEQDAVFISDKINKLSTSHLLFFDPSASLPVTDYCRQLSS